MATQQVLDHLASLGFDALGTVRYNLPSDDITRIAVERGEGNLTEHGVFVGYTAPHTGRSPEDRFVVDTPDTRDEVGWNKTNQAVSEEVFDRLLAKMNAYAEGRNLFVVDALAGADERYRIPVRVVTELAWHSQFAANMFIEEGMFASVDGPNRGNGVFPEHGDGVTKRIFTVISLPGFKADPAVDGTRTETFILMNLSRRIVLIGGTKYSGEIKKSIFSALNFLLPRHNVFPMHCSANTDGDTTALFFGLSGTGKTTLSADSRRTLIGDDEHGWSDEGVFNFEGGCYAKTIKLSKEGEPEIFATTQMPGSILENVVVSDAGVVDFNDASITENTRISYPIAFIPNASETGLAGHPQYVIFLTADAFGVLPPVARLTPEQAMFHFLSGYTAKLAGTERGVKEPKATFSTCFGGPFMVRRATDYATMLGDRLRTHDAKVFLLNTGWTGGPYGIGNRHNLAHTRAMVDAILSGKLDDVETTTEPYFGLAVPVAVPGVPSDVLDTRSTWADSAAYDAQAHRVQQMFADNFAQFADHVAPEVLAAVPQPHAPIDAAFVTYK
ncbi:MAG: phosphoenolpyruvate carboxykinase (ATP) [Bacteroidetes bacterium]|nr:phosphoenolpyruvate carboxykinase (ATP) [Bacteroidota bacterium]